MLILNEMKNIIIKAFSAVVIQDVEKCKNSWYGLNYVEEIKKNLKSLGLLGAVNIEEIKRGIREELEEKFNDRVFVSEYDRKRQVLIIDGYVKEFDYQMIIFRR